MPMAAMELPTGRDPGAAPRLHLTWKTGVKTYLHMHNPIIVYLHILYYILLYYIIILHYIIYILCHKYIPISIHIDRWDAVRSDKMRWDRYTSSSYFPCWDMVFSYSPGGGLSGLAGCEPTSKRPRAGAESVNCMLYTWFDVNLYLLCAYMYMYVCVYI